MEIERRNAPKETVGRLLETYFIPKWFYGANELSGMSGDGKTRLLKKLYELLRVFYLTVRTVLISNEKYAQVSKFDKIFNIESDKHKNIIKIHEGTFNDYLEYLTGLGLMLDLINREFNFLIAWDISVNLENENDTLELE